VDRPHGLTPRAWFVVLAVFLVLLAAWPVCFGWSAAHSLGASVFLALFVWLPGRAVLSWSVLPEDALERGFLSWAAGCAVVCLWFFAGCLIDLRAITWLLPPIAALALYLARGRTASTGWRGPVPRELLLLALVLALTLIRSHPDRPDEWFLGQNSDDNFHAANVGELRWRWPMEDVRLAGLPMRYHFLAYTLPAALEKVINVPGREILLGLTKHHAPLLFSLGVFVVVRALGVRAWIAAAAALSLALHVDLGRVLKGSPGVDWSQNANFDVGLYDSITNSVSLCLLLGLLLLLPRLLDVGGRVRGPMALAFVLALAASATKVSVLPPLIAGLGLAAVWKFVRGGGLDRRLAGSVVCFTLAAMPLALWISVHTGGYAKAVFRLLPGYSQRSGGFEKEIAAHLGLSGDPTWLAIALLPVWLLAIFGAAGIGLLAWAVARGERRAEIEAPCAWAVLAGMLPSYLLASPGNSQLFFGNVSIVCGTLLGALGVQRCLAVKGALPRTLAGLAGVVLAAHVLAVLSGPLARPNLPIARTGEPEQYQAGLEWMRTNLPPEAVLLVDDVRLCPGAWSERRMFYDTPRFTPQQRALWDPNLPGTGMPAQKPYEDRARAQRAFLAQPSAAGLAEVRRLLGTEAPLYALRSRAVLEVRNKRFELDAPPREGQDPIEALCGAPPVFQNRVAAVYRLP
jgi:hypothetical protein